MPSIRGQQTPVNISKYAILAEIPRAGHETGLTQAQIAERMGARASAVRAWKTPWSQANIRRLSTPCAKMLIKSLCFNRKRMSKKTAYVKNGDKNSILTSIDAYRQPGL